MDKCVHLIKGKICSKSARSMHPQCCVCCLFEKDLPHACSACGKASDGLFVSLSGDTMGQYEKPCATIKEILELSKWEQLIVTGWVNDKKKKND